MIPAIATSYTVSQDGLVWTFNLRRDKKWSNGDPVTAHDFVFAWLRFLSPEQPTAPMWAGPQQFLKNAWAYKGGAVGPDEVGIRAVDDWTLELTLARPKPGLIGALVLASAVPLHQASVEANPTDWWKPGNLIVNGPYMIDSWVPDGETVLVKNPRYVGEHVGNVDRILLKPGGLGLQQYEAGEIDYAFIGTTGDYAYVRRHPTLRNHLVEDVALDAMTYQVVRNTRHALFDDDRVRLAFAMAVDKKTLTEVVRAARSVPTDAYGPPGDVVTREIKGIPYDVTRARQLLTEAGYPNGRGFPTVTFYAPPATAGDMPVIEFLAEQWKQNLGVNVEIENLEWGPLGAIQWTTWNDHVNPGFTLLPTGLNWFEPYYLLRISSHTTYFQDHPQHVRQTLWQRGQDRGAIDRLEGGLTQADWNALLAETARLRNTWQQIVDQAREAGAAAWVREQTTSPIWFETVDALYKEWQAAADDETKTTLYRRAVRVNYDQETFQFEMLNTNPTNLQQKYLLADLHASTLEEAPAIAAKLQQMYVERAFMVPLYTDKRIYIKRPNLDGIVVNKLAWGNIFNFRYLNVR